MKKLTAIVLAAALIFGLMGCGSSAETTVTSETTQEMTENVETISDETQPLAKEPKAQTKIVTDHAGVEVEVPTQIDRIVVGSFYPLASVLTVYLGGADKIVGIHPVSMSAAKNGLLSEIYPEILNAETGFINGSEINVEELLKLNPDIVLGVGKEQAQMLREAGIPAVTFSAAAWNYDVVETYDHWIELLDQIFGKSEISDKVAAYSKEVYADVQQKVSTIAQEDKKKVLVLFQYDDSAMIASGPNFFGQFWCDASGAVNVAAQTEGNSVQINMEQVYEWNPDIIVITNFTGTQPEDLYNNAIGNDDWSTVNAVKNKQVYKMPLGLYRSFTPGADTPVTLQWFAKTVNPELFADTDIEEVTRTYFKDYYGIDLNEEQLNKMYHPAREGADGL